MSLTLRCQPACEVFDCFLAGYSEAEIAAARSAPRYTSLGFPDLCVPKTLSMSCGQAIFVDQAIAASLFSDAVLAKIDWFG